MILVFSASYYRPTEKEVLADYLKAVDVLTVNGDKQRLQKQVEELKQETKDSEYIIGGKLQEKEKEILLLNQRDSINADAIASLSDQLARVMQEIEALKKQR